MRFLGGIENSKIEIISELLRRKRIFGDINVGRVNKVLTLFVAREVGLLVPDSLLTGQRDQLQAFSKKHRTIVCKSFDLGYNFIDEKKRTTSLVYTNVVTEKYIEALSETFPLTFFQEYIEKDFEIRCFYFHQKCFANAVFSQNNPRTKVDYRHSNKTNPLRQVPITLTNDLRKKIVNIFEKISLNTGSLDILVKGKDYYFLEVNPVGIYDNVSGYGSWYIEKEIADYLVGAG